MNTKIRTRLACLTLLMGVAACSSAKNEAEHPSTEGTSGSETAQARAADAQDTTPREPHGDVPEQTRPGRLASDVPGAVDPGAPPVVPLEDSEAAPDNTAVNERDRDNQSLTPGDQSNSERDLEITQRIRETVVDDDSLSFSAKNVKIITVDGRVTLRGPVKNDAERAAIEKAAVAVAGKGQVENQLEVR